MPFMTATCFVQQVATSRRIELLGCEPACNQGAPCCSSQALEALHAVYEDCKLHVLRLANLSDLGRLLAAVATLLRAPLYVDHYLRDLGPSCLPPAGSRLLEQSVAPDAAKHNSLAEPADMHRSLLRLLQQPQVLTSLLLALCSLLLLSLLDEVKCSNLDAMDGASLVRVEAQQCYAADQDALDGLVPQLAAAGHPVVERSSQLLRFYRTLARSEAVCTRELLARRKLLPGSDHLQHRQQVRYSQRLYEASCQLSGQEYVSHALTLLLGFALNDVSYVIQHCPTCKPSEPVQTLHCRRGGP